MTTIDVELRVKATVEVEEPLVDAVRLRVQQGLDAAVEALEEHGATFDPDQVWIARVREEEGVGGEG